MSTKYNRNFTNFQNLHLKGSGTLNGVSIPGMMSVNIGGFEATLAASANADQDVAWTMPAKAGNIPVAGTFTVNMGAVTAGNYSETAVAVTGLRSDDLFLCQMVTPSETSVTTNRGRLIYTGASAVANGFATLQFFNPTATATVAGSHVMAYVAFR